MKKGTKRKAAAASHKDDAAPTSTEPAATATTTTTTEEPKQQHKKEPTKAGRPIKRSKVAKSEPEPEFFDDQRELEDLWKQVVSPFPPSTLKFAHPCYTMPDMCTHLKRALGLNTRRMDDDENKVESKQRDYEHSPKASSGERR
ncbi:hypothetical protein L2E82_35957 [Cichorium intybus]|uniref:Uncharacterized protein n=1 Tax=Cichorium intybus TaxID=13427 RepID=A0ACB9BQ75_CICIN|nr:hypothetical protein L2E82_35957 [Cichorium intybus]